jgi:hypothetical protein
MEINMVRGMLAAVQQLVVRSPGQQPQQPSLQQPPQQPDDQSLMGDASQGNRSDV